MTFRTVSLCLLCCLLGAGVGAQTTPNWLFEAVTLRLPQSTIVRHPIDSGKYYLCWTDGQSRFGMSFRKSNLDNNLRNLRRGERKSVASMLTADMAGWSAADERICWPR